MPCIVVESAAGRQSFPGAPDLRSRFSDNRPPLGQERWSRSQVYVGASSWCAFPPVCIPCRVSGGKLLCTDSRNHQHQAQQQRIHAYLMSSHHGRISPGAILSLDLSIPWQTMPPTARITAPLSQARAATSATAVRQAWRAGFWGKVPSITSCQSRGCNCYYDKSSSRCEELLLLACDSLLAGCGSCARCVSAVLPVPFLPVGCLPARVRTEHLAGLSDLGHFVGLLPSLSPASVEDASVKEPYYPMSI